MLYDCEIEGCTNKTDDFLCVHHEVEARNENMQITICETCNKIIEIKRKKPAEARYTFAKDCMRCNPHQIEPGMFEGQAPPDALPPE